MAIFERFYLNTKRRRSFEKWQHQNYRNLFAPFSERFKKNKQSFG